MVHFVHRIARFHGAAAYTDHLEAESACIAGEVDSDGADADQYDRLAAQVVRQRDAAQRSCFCWPRT